MANLLEDVYLACDSLDICHIADFTFFKHLDCNFLTSLAVDTQLHFSEGALSKITSEDVVADAAAGLQTGVIFSVSHRIKLLAMRADK
jgi:hypothetical protein